MTKTTDEKSPPHVVVHTPSGSYRLHQGPGWKDAERLLTEGKILEAFTLADSLMLGQTFGPAMMRVMPRLAALNDGAWMESATGLRYARVTGEGFTDPHILFDTAEIARDLPDLRGWVLRWEHDLGREIAKHLDGKETKLVKLGEMHYRLPGTV